MEKEEKRISHQFFRIASQFSEMERKTQLSLEDETFVYAEMRLVKIIKEQPNIHVKAIAEKLGITKGAVSQMAKKLERKGVLWKEKDEENQSRVFLRLTEKGERLYQVHGAYHRELDDFVKETLAQASEENKQFLLAFLDRLEKHILQIHIQ